MQEVARQKKERDREERDRRDRPLKKVGPRTTWFSWNCWSNIFRKAKCWKSQHPRSSRSTERPPPRSRALNDPVSTSFTSKWWSASARSGAKSRSPTTCRRTRPRQSSMRWSRSSASRFDPVPFNCIDNVALIFFFSFCCCLWPAPGIDRWYHPSLSTAVLRRRSSLWTCCGPDPC